MKILILFPLSDRDLIFPVIAPPVKEQPTAKNNGHLDQEQMKYEYRKLPKNETISWSPVAIQWRVKNAVEGFIVNIMVSAIWG